MLDRECGDDAELRSEVELLLGEQGHAESLLDTAAWEAAATAFLDDADPPVPRLSAGGRLGPFIIQEPAGAGGMGEVYRATDTRLDRTVAIKVLPPDTAADAESRRRLHLEARAASALTHPHICALFDIRSDDGCEYLVMRAPSKAVRSHSGWRPPMCTAQAHGCRSMRLWPAAFRLRTPWRPRIAVASPTVTSSPAT